MPTRRRASVDRELRDAAAQSAFRNGGEEMATCVSVHGGGDVGWYWHLVQDELQQRGQEVGAPDLPCDHDAADLLGYAEMVVDAIGDRRDLAEQALSKERSESETAFDSPWPLEAWPSHANSRTCSTATCPLA